MLLKKKKNLLVLTIGNRNVEDTVINALYYLFKGIIDHYDFIKSAPANFPPSSLKKLDLTSSLIIQAIRGTDKSSPLKGQVRFIESRALNQRNEFKIIKPFSALELDLYQAAAFFREGTVLSMPRLTRIMTRLSILLS